MSLWQYVRESFQVREKKNNFNAQAGVGWGAVEGGGGGIG